MATPRDLDPKFKNEKPESVTPTQEQEKPESVTPTQEQEKPESEQDDTPMTVYREKYIDENGNLAEREHRVPTAEWPAYEKEHGF